MKRLALCAMLVILALFICACTAPDDRQTGQFAAQATRAAVWEVGYTPEAASTLQSATLTWTLPQEDRAIVHAAALTDKAGLRTLETLLQTAQPHEPAGKFSADVCHELTLIRQDGAVIRLDVAMDGSSMVRAGESYYACMPADPAKNPNPLYELFGATQ